MGNGNGKIDLAEFRQGHEQHPEASMELKEDFSGLDQDGDGQLSLAELKPWTDGSFTMKKMLGPVIIIADQDNDHHVTVEELRQAGDAGKISSAVELQLKQWALHEEF